MKRILFIGHVANRTGAPFVLLHLLRWLKENSPGTAMDLLLLRGGDLVQDYESAAEVFVLRRIENSDLHRGFEYLKKKLKGKPTLMTSKLPPFKRKYDVVLGNTVESMEYLRSFKNKGFRTICWLHELEYTVTSCFSKEKFIELAKGIDLFIAGSRSVRTMLSDFGIETKTVVVYDFSPVDPAGGEDPATIKRELNIPASTFLVGGGGTVEWRKGVDLFLQIALYLKKKHSDIYCVWIGGRPALAEMDYSRIQFDLKRLDLEGRVIFTDQRPDYRRFLSAIDLFALTSREDPFPLICLEAASFGRPIVCFENAGGMPEFVEDNAGAVVPYGDTESFGQKISDFYSNRNELRRAGEAALEKLSTRFSLEGSCRKIKDLLEQ